MGKAVSQHTKRSVDFSNFSQHLEGETLPDVTPDDIGKYRLRLFLRRKFGAGYSSHPVAQGMLEHFETNKRAFSRVR